MRVKLIGAAGSGKTTAVLSRLNDLARDPFEVAFSSLTNAARDAIIPRAASMYGVDPKDLQKSGWWRTTHSTAIRCMGLSQSILFPGSKEHEEVLQWAVSPRCRTDVTDTHRRAIELWSVARTAGQSLAAVVERSTRVDRTTPKKSDVIRWATEYERVKRVKGVVDVVDPMMMFAGIRQAPDGDPREVPPLGDAPTDIRVMVLDECQDASSLIYRVQRRIELESKPEHLILAADPYQSLFSFIGGDPRFFLEWQVDQEIAMERSWRCAGPIFALGQRCLQGCSNYRDFGIKPADHEGAVERSRSLARALANRVPGSTMVLARTNALAATLRNELKTIGTPVTEIGTPATAVHEACYWLDRLSSGKVIAAEHFAKVAARLPANKYFTRGMKTAWRDGRVELDAVVPEALAAAGVSDYGASAIRGRGWFEDIKGAEDWKATAARHGAEEATWPTLSVGTVHASKGLEADNVIVSDELPELVLRSMRYSRAARDEERRVSYVAVTRARKKATVLTLGGMGRRAEWLK